MQAASLFAALHELGLRELLLLLLLLVVVVVCVRVVLPLVCVGCGVCVVLVGEGGLLGVGGRTDGEQACSSRQAMWWRIICVPMCACVRVCVCDLLKEQAMWWRIICVCPCVRAFVCVCMCVCVTCSRSKPCGGASSVCVHVCVRSCV